MTNYYSFVPAFPGFPYNLFHHIVSDCKDSDIIIEVGAMFGHGTCFMAESLCDADKRPKFYVIDPWDEPLEKVHGERRKGALPWGEDIEKWRARGGSMFDSFQFYLENCPAHDYVYDYAQFPCKSSHGEFEDFSLSYVFINYARDYEGILAEVRGWWPKLKVGGVLAAHGCSESFKALESLHNEVNGRFPINQWNEITWSLIK